MAKTNTCYDYELQQWVDDPARKLTQLRDEVALMKSSQGREFAAFINVDYDSYLVEAETALTAHLATMGDAATDDSASSARLGPWDLP